MNLDDILYTGSRPTTLRIVLGLMEDAENSLETYRWAVPALMHSYDTEDKELFRRWKLQHNQAEGEES